MFGPQQGGHFTSSIKELEKLGHIEKTIKSVTFDNGGEFKQFGLLGLKGIKVYFCDPGSPYQKGQVERTNAILHKFIPKKTDFNSITSGQLKDAEDKLNNLPRKCLNFLIPDEAWNRISTRVALRSPESSLQAAVKAG